MQTTAVAPQWITAGAAIVGLAGVLVTLIVNGIRAERHRRRDLHARALAAIVGYGEMPYRIRRRAPGPEARSRLCDDLAIVKAEVIVCQLLLASDGDQRLAEAFDDLYATARRTIGVEAHAAWAAPVIEEDEHVNMGGLYRKLEAFNIATDRFSDDLRVATLPWVRRALRRFRGALPWAGDSASKTSRRIIAPQDLSTEVVPSSVGSRADSRVDRLSL